MNGPQVIVRMSSTLGIGIAGWILYDRKTMHPMRDMAGYDVNGSLIRFHNTFRPSVTYPSMTLQELSKYDGSSNNESKIYFSSDGFIWDVSNSKMFNESYGIWKGKDASVSLAKMSMDPADVNRTDVESLTDAEWKSLESWSDYFLQKYYIKAKLKNFPSSRKR